MINQDENIVNVKIGHNGYDPIHFYYEIGNTLIKPKDRKKIFFGVQEQKVCRFCKKDSTQTSFKNKAHIIPEFMGNKNFFSNFECDNCNHLFSFYETSLSSYGGILNTFSKVKGKRGYSKHKSNIENAETFVEKDKVIMKIIRPNKKDSIISVNYDEAIETMTFRTTKNSYIPLDAFKALVKIGICLLPENDLAYYDLTRQWLLNENTINIEASKPLLNVFQKIGGRHFEHPWAILMKRRESAKQEPCPKHSVILFYGIFGFQFFIPGNILDQWILNGKRIILPIENHISYETRDSKNKLKTGVNIIDFSSAKKQVNPKHTFKVSFKKS